MKHKFTLHVKYSFTFRLANQFWSDPSFTSSYIEATFKPRAANSNEVTLLIPNIFNPGETLPVNIPRKQLVNIYMALINQLTDPDDINQPAPRGIPTEWY